MELAVEFVAAAERHRTVANVIPDTVEDKGQAELPLQ